jgi:hypothetical protein
MAVNAGDIIEISYNHPTVGSGVLSPVAAQDNEYDIGGVRTVDDENSVTAKGEAIYVMNMKRWAATALVTSDMNIRQEYEKMVAISQSLDEATWTFLHINGTTYRGKGKPAGDLKLNVNAGTFSLKISGGSQFVQ